MRLNKHLFYPSLQRSGRAGAHLRAYKLFDNCPPERGNNLCSKRVFYDQKGGGSLRGNLSCPTAFFVGPSANASVVSERLPRSLPCTSFKKGQTRRAAVELYIFRHLCAFEPAHV